ncbi:hypothetical protein [Bacillus sp. AFS076308]|uniref:hypothetical protein n=1 Tax=Bacillus sp. AFS076308 TaxID=2033512 RepID=UPI0011451D4D|nr:hypothetical protein [Bacillus sp. AFS076308]
MYVVDYRKAGEFGVLLTFEDGRYASVMELGVPVSAPRYVYGKPIIRKEKDFTFIDPVKCRINYRILTKAGILRLPSFVEWIK